MLKNLSIILWARLRGIFRHGIFSRVYFGFGILWWQYYDRDIMSRNHRGHVGREEKTSEKRTDGQKAEKIVCSSFLSRWRRVKFRSADIVGHRDHGVFVVKVAMSFSLPRSKKLRCTGVSCRRGCRLEIKPELVVRQGSWTLTYLP